MPVVTSLAAYMVLNKKNFIETATENLNLIRQYL
ncbi:MAG: hypothetical protein BWX65_00064 [Bacteroidetes bacterium ADurb.Bin057]|nr:MAG: hypothetical protein BWX65_00064 [Bacteroidetes bacterium ADurb.Bin057]